MARKKLFASRDDRLHHQAGGFRQTCRDNDGTAGYGSTVRPAKGMGHDAWPGALAVLLAQISTWPPSSMTRFGGIRKNSVAASALRCIASNNLQRTAPNCDLRSGTSVTRPTK